MNRVLEIIERDLSVLEQAVNRLLTDEQESESGSHEDKPS